MICPGLLHVSGNLLERSEPNAGLGLHVSDQLLDLHYSQRVPGDMWMHGEDEQPLSWYAPSNSAL